MESRPVRVIPVHAFLRPKLMELYESDSIFDKFEVSVARDGATMMTGSYNGCFKVYDARCGSETTIELAKARPKVPVVRRILASDGAVGIGGLPAGTAVGAAGGGGGAAGGRAGGGAVDPWGVDDDVTMAGTAPPTVTGADGIDATSVPINPDELDLKNKVLHFSWHPYDDIVAVAGMNNLYIYNAL